MTVSGEPVVSDDVRGSVETGHAEAAGNLFEASGVGVHLLGKPLANGLSAGHAGWWTRANLSRRRIIIPPALPWRALVDFPGFG